VAQFILAVVFYRPAPPDPELMWLEVRLFVVGFLFWRLLVSRQRRSAEKAWSAFDDGVLRLLQAASAFCEVPCDVNFGRMRAAAAHSVFLFKGVQSVDADALPGVAWERYLEWVRVQERRWLRDRGI
jgi:hypothetical protein